MTDGQAGATGPALTSPVEIKDEATYRSIMKTLSTQDQAPAILKFLMGSFEAYRAARKIGWARPWNKNGVTTFHSFKLEFPRDQDLINQAGTVLAETCAKMPGVAGKFVGELLNDEKLMGYVFMQEVSSGNGRFESVTLSFGRRVKKRYRDRLDLILEAPVEGATVGAFSRLRVFVDPHAEQHDPIWRKTFDDVSSEAAAALFDTLSKLSWQWAGDGNRVWDHWTSDYVDYFGRRQWSLDASHFAPSVQNN